MSLFGGLRRGTSERAISELDVPWGRDTALGTTINEVSAFNLSAVWACQTLIADSIAGMPVDVFRKVDDVREPVTAPRWVDTPNKWETRLDFDNQRIMSLLGWGNAYVLVMRRNGSSDPLAPVTERWVIDPWRVEVKKDGYGSLVYTVDGVPVPVGNIQHIPGYKLPGRMKGMSPIEYMRRSLSVGSQAEQFAETLLANGVNPSGVLQIPSMPKETSKDVVDSLRDQFSSRYASASNAGKPMVLTGGTEWHQVSLNPVDAELLSSRRFQVEEIARWYGVPAHMIGDMSGSTTLGSSIEHQSMNFVRFTLLPWVRRLELADSALLTRPTFLSYNFASLQRADIKTRYEAYKMAREGGWKSANDVLKLEDESPIPNGDIYLQPMNYVEAGSAPGPTGPPASPTQEPQT